MAAEKPLIIVIVILLTSCIYKSLGTSSNEYCQSNQCDSDENVFDSSLTDEEAVKEYIRRYGIDRIDNFIKARLDVGRNTVLKIAVTGASNSGKSMLINTLRGLTPDDIGAAPLGSTETTIEIQRYSHPKNKNLKFYDLPGFGTMNFRKEKYLEAVNYQKYDFFIIVSKGFTEDDLWLSQEIKKCGKAFFFIRSRVDEDLANEKRDHPKTFNEEKVLEKIRKKSSEYIKATDPTANVFVISGLLENTRQFDYSVMEQTLCTSVPEYKRHAMIMSMTMASKEGLKATVKILTSEAWMIGILSGGVGAIPVTGLSFAIDYVLISRTISDYKNQLGLDEVSLQRLAKRHSLSLDEINEKLTGGWKGDLLKNNVKNYVFKALGKYAVANTVKEFSRFIPLVGLGVAAITTASTTLAVLNDSLNEMLTAALSIVDLIK